LVRHVAAVGFALDGVKQWRGHTQGDGLGAGLEIGENDLLRFRPIECAPLARGHLARSASLPGLFDAFDQLGKHFVAHFSSSYTGLRREGRERQRT